MGSKVYTETTITDLRQAAEADVVSGVGSQLALPGGIALGEGANLSIAGTAPMDAGKTFEQLLSNTDSTIGRVLGLTSQLAAGLFEQTPAGVAAAQPIQRASVAGDTTAVVLLIALVVGYIFFFGRR